MPKPKRDFMVPVMQIKSTETGQVITSFYILEPGDTFPRFGGSSRGLLVQKTASLITRTTQGGTISDHEYNLYDPTVWAWVARMITDKTLNITADGPPGAVG